MPRLENIAPEIAKRLTNAPLQKQRNASLVACEFAISASGVKYPESIRALHKLKNEEPFSMAEKSALENLVTQLDNEYFRLQEKANGGMAFAHNSLQAFSQARAVSSLLFAINTDQLSASEAIYEASSSVDDNKKLFDAILTLLE